jgi:hypothetical protein
MADKVSNTARGREVCSQRQSLTFGYARGTANAGLIRMGEKLVFASSEWDSGWSNAMTVVNFNSCQLLTGAAYEDID